MALLTVRDLHAQFFTERGIVHAVNGVSFDLHPEEIVGVVGESGSGKSVTALSIMRLIAADKGHIQARELSLDGTDLLGLKESAMNAIRGGQIGMIFQDPMRSLNPVLTIGRQITEVLLRHTAVDRSGAKRRAIELLGLVGIPAPDHKMSALPHQLSGGMRQRVMIAIALSCRPKLLIADEATTALDVTIQAQIVDLIKTLARESGTAVLWISHALGLVANLCHRVNVMYAGKIVEQAAVDDIFHRPAHGYTLSLLRSTPRIDQLPPERMPQIDGMPPDMTAPSPLCAFLPRCPLAIEACRHEAPVYRNHSADHVASCFANIEPTEQVLS